MHGANIKKFYNNLCALVGQIKDLVDCIFCVSNSLFAEIFIYLSTISVAEGLCNSNVRDVPGWLLVWDVDNSGCGY